MPGPRPGPAPAFHGDRDHAARLGDQGRPRIRLQADLKKFNMSENTSWKSPDRDRDGSIHWQALTESSTVGDLTEVTVAGFNLKFFDLHGRRTRKGGRGRYRGGTPEIGIEVWG